MTLTAEARVRSARDKTVAKRQLVFFGIPCALIAITIFTYPQFLPWSSVASSTN